VPRRRGRVLACGVAGAGAVACAVAVTVPAATGCYTHQCDASSYDYAPGVAGYLGHMVDANTFETSGWDETWMNYPGMVTVNVRFPYDVGRAPTSIKGYVGTGDTPNSPLGGDFQGGENWVETSGQLAEYFFAGSGGFSVSNASCASYFARFVVSFVPESLVLFGGTSGSITFDETWAWNGSSWVQPTTGPFPPPPPPPKEDGGAPPVLACSDGGTVSDGGIVPCWPIWRTGAVMAALDGKITMFGGTPDGQHPVDEPTTWTWDGVNWTALTPAHTPPPRFDAASGIAPAVDPLGNVVPQLVVFGGRGASGATRDGGSAAVDLNDTWAWNGFDWTEQKPTTPPPSPRSGAASASLAGGLVVFGGSSNGGPPLAETWLWRGGGWTQVLAGASNGTGPSARVHASATTFGADVLLFGGNTGAVDLGDTWLWNGSTWTQAAASGPAPSARSSAALATFAGAAVLFGGLSGSTSFGDTWTWNGSAWTEQNLQPGAASPSARGGAVAASN